MPQYQRRPLSQRPLDVLFFVYFLTRIPICIISDIAPIFPPEYVPQFSKTLNTILTQQFGDPLMVSGEAFAPGRVWFHSMLVAQLALQLPFCFYAAYAILSDSPCRRVPLLMYGVHVVTTMIPTLSTLVWDSPQLDEYTRSTLIGLYVPYLLIPLSIIAQSLLAYSKSCHQATVSASASAKKNK
ncbi:hypothetical protein GQ42DRAFT_166087 [Ramicandelaber brevisporus]|nr:hypothetical protein GQ42DRAFT_166087 [Ramicandelaber brevisporus]